MLFNSVEFIFLFLPFTFFVYFFLNRKRLLIASKAWLLFSSMFFYSWWNIIYLPLIITSIFVNFLISSNIINFDKNKKINFSKKKMLMIGLFFNIGLLGYFKYMDFFIENANFIFGTNIGLINLILPLAISFFTLQQIAFLVDSYEGLIKEKNFLNYATFVSFFPQLIAGPIVYHNEMMHQFTNLKKKVINYKNIITGLFIFSIGLFKKVVIADTFAAWATNGFDVSSSLNFFEAWFTSFSYTFQLYFDFSGYTDMAIGAALLFNINLPQNFNSPLKSTSIIEFWSRWHITLTRFITTYIYTPIVRSFENLSFSKAMIATFVTFLISGLWHGASWMFVIWGGLHGLALVINHIWRKKLKIKMNKFLAWVITFNFINFSLVFFRANNLDDAIKLLKGMTDVSNIVIPSSLHSSLGFLSHFGIKFGGFMNNILFEQGFEKLWGIAYLFVAFFIVLFFKNTSSICENKRYIEKYYFFAAMFVFATLRLNEYSEFIYFRF